MLLALLSYKDSPVLSSFLWVVTDDTKTWSSTTACIYFAYESGGFCSYAFFKQLNLFAETHKQSIESSEVS